MLRDCYNPIRNMFNREDGEIPAKAICVIDLSLLASYSPSSYLVSGLNIYDYLFKGNVDDMLIKALDESILLHIIEWTETHTEDHASMDNNVEHFPYNPSGISILLDAELERLHLTVDTAFDLDGSWPADVLAFMYAYVAEVSMLYINLVSRAMRIPTVLEEQSRNIHNLYRQDPHSLASIETDLQMEKIYGYYLIY